mgnify:CR=1 FL=1
MCWTAWRGRRRAGSVTARPWWRPAFVEADGESTAVLADQLRSALRTAVAGARPDGRSGAFLSGGLDSSTVAGVLSEIIDEQREFDESIELRRERHRTKLVIVLSVATAAEVLLIWRLLEA